MFYGDLAARLLHLFGGTQHVITAIHSTSIGSRRFERVMRWSDRYADAVTAVSNVVARAQIEAGSVPAEKVTVIYNGIDLRRFARPPSSEIEAHRARLGLSEGRVLLCVGRLEPEKDHAQLLRAFKKLLTKVNDITLVLVGPGRLEAELRALASSLGIAERVRFAGQISPIAPIFYLADVFVLCSWREGLPLVVLEAMASGVPMVLTSVGGIPEIVEHEKTGILVPARDESALAAALERVFVMSPTEREGMATAARECVKERFSMETMKSPQRKTCTTACLHQTREACDTSSRFRSILGGSVRTAEFDDSKSLASRRDHRSR